MFNITGYWLMSRLKGILTSRPYSKKNKASYAHYAVEIYY